MKYQFIRSEVLLGSRAIKKLNESRVLVAGLGGIGSWCAEALARSGVGSIVLVDGDVVEESNINRQLFALHTTLGQAKSQAAHDRFLQINPDMQIIAKQVFILRETVDALLEETSPDFVIDAIDSVSPKSHLIRGSHEKNIPLISCLGAALKRDPSRFKLTSLFKTHTCPLARALRTCLRKQGIRSGIDCVFSDEAPYYSGLEVSGYEGKKFLGSYMPVVATAGLLAADYCIKKLISPENSRQI